MSESNLEIIAALKRNGVRDVDDSTLTRGIYSTDASLYRVVPQVVVRPRDIDEVQAVGSLRSRQGVVLRNQDSTYFTRSWNVHRR